jgi:hypothetical protein
LKERSCIARLKFGIWKLITFGGGEHWQMSSMRGEGKRNLSVVGMHKNTKMKISSLERRVVKSGSGNSNQEMLSGNKVTDLRNVGTLAYNVNCKWEPQLKRREPVLERN